MTEIPQCSEELEQNRVTQFVTNPTTSFLLVSTRLLTVGPDVQNVVPLHSIALLNWIVVE